MPTPRVLVLGAGSSGRRHAREFHAAGADVAVADPDPSRAEAADIGRPVPYDLDQLADYDGVVVASPTAYHGEQTLAILATPAFALIEKPLAAGVDELEEIVRLGAGRVMVGYNLRLHRPLKRVVELVHAGCAGRVSSVRLWFGSWLPDWRPAVDYRTTYSARAALGGGILLDSIHELDVLVWLLGLGRYEILGAIVDRLGSLEIDVEDTVKALLRHESGVVAELSLDYLSRRYRRGIEVIGDQATLRLDWARAALEIETAAGVATEAADVPLAESYALQAARFLAFMAGDAAPPVDVVEGAYSVHLADRIRACAKGRR